MDIIDSNILLIILLDKFVVMLFYPLFSSTFRSVYLKCNKTVVWKGFLSFVFYNRLGMPRDCIVHSNIRLGFKTLRR